MAVHFPLRRIYLQKDKRTLKYVLSVLLLSSLFTVSRFLEAEVIYVNQLEENDEFNKSTAYLKPTELRLSPNYIKYYNWSRLVALGVVPFIMLVYLNGLMYQDIKSRRQRWSYKENSGGSTTATDIVLNTLSTNVVDEPDKLTHKLIKNETFEVTGADSRQKILGYL